MMSSGRKIAQVSLSSARSCLEKQNYGRAFANFLLFLKLAPERCEEVRNEFSVAMREWSECLERDHKIVDLFKCYDQACEMFPNHDTVLNNIGAQLFRLGYAEEAVAYIRRALIINPDYLAARENLENICSHLVERWHFRMLNDYKRNKAYKDAIRSAVHKGYTSVLDIGAGTGILSLIACDVGATTVYACERSHAMYEVARDVLETNCADDRVLLFHRSSTDLSVPEDLSQKVSLVVTETFDAGLFGEHIVSTLTHAWRNLLCNSQSMRGSVVPCAATMYVCGIESEALRKQNRLIYPVLQNLDLSGVDIVCSTGQVAEEPYTTENLAWLRGGYKILTNVSELLRVNFCNPQELEALQLGKDWVANLTVKKHGRLDALAVWFDLHLDECVTIATGPDTENCWEQAVYPVQTVQREKDTGQELCYLNMRESLQVTFHFEHDCLRLSECTASPNKHQESTKQSFKDSHKEHISNSGDNSIRATINRHNSSVLPFRKRKIKNQYSENEVNDLADVGNGKFETEMAGLNNVVMDNVMLPNSSFYPPPVAMSTDEYLLQQCGNLTINNGTRHSTGSSASGGLNTNYIAGAEAQMDAVSQLDDFNLARFSSRLDHQSSTTQFNPGDQSRLSASQNHTDQSCSNTEKGDQDPKTLVAYLEDSDDDTDICGPKLDEMEQKNDVFMSSNNPGTSLMHLESDKIDSLMQENGRIGISSENAIKGLVSPLIDSSRDPNSISAPEYDLHEDNMVASVNGVDSGTNNLENKLCVSIALADLEVIDDLPVSDNVTQKNNCAILETNKSENLKKDGLHIQSQALGVKSKDYSSLKRLSNKLVCLAEHSDIMFLNDIHLNRTCFRALESLSQNQEKISRSLYYNTTRLCFLPLQAMTLTFDPVTIATAAEHHGTIETVMATNNLRPEDVRLLDLSESEENHGKYDVMMFDLVEPCGALRQQILEDIAVMRVTSLSEGGTIVPGIVTIRGMFIESTELEKTSHVIGSHMTLGYSIADFINVFQLRNHVDIDLETLRHEKMTEVFQMFNLDLNCHDNSDSLDCLHQTNQISLKVLETGNIHALVYWFEFELTDGIKISTLDPRSHWRQAGIMMKDEIQVEANQDLVAMVTLQNSCLDVILRTGGQVT